MTKTTSTGNYSIGFRRGFDAWQKDLDAVIDFAKAEGFGFIDLERDADTSGKTVLDAGLGLGSVDLADWTNIMSPDAGVRREAIQRNQSYIRDCASLGPSKFFCVLGAPDVSLGLQANFDTCVESIGELTDELRASGSTVVIEGCPGPSLVACTPAQYREFFRRLPGDAFGYNYDPSHLIRMGIDPLRTLREFAGNVRHVHAKDTAIDTEALYEHGWFQPSFQKPVAFGGTYWHYALPGHGEFNWSVGLEILTDAGYDGVVSIELEDYRFMGSAEAEQQGYRLARDFLCGC